jgi:4-hydroxybenzoyl-CoA thioesterase
MRITRRDHFIEFSDCDPAGIVYFARYFEWFDAATQNHFAQADLAAPQRLARFGHHIGFPMVDAHATYHLSSTYHETVTVETRIQEFRRSSFVVYHRLLRGEALAVEAWETRVWAGPDPEAVLTPGLGPKKLKSFAIPEEVKALFNTES